MVTVTKVPAQLKFAAVSLWTASSDYLSRGEPYHESVDIDWKPRICLAKTTACRELYNVPTPAEMGSLIFSAFWRTGPVGLMQSLGGDMRIVHTVKDEESEVYLRREKGSAAAVRYRLQNQERLEPNAVHVDSIDWGQYDLVVSFENAVPSRLAQQHRQTLFVSMMEDHRGEDYSRFRKCLPKGYRLFFNLRTGPSPHDFTRRPWEVDFTYGFRDAGALTKLLPGVQKEEIIHLETHERPENASVLENATGMRTVQYRASESKVLSEGIRPYYELTRRAKYFVSVQPSRPLGGLASIDAASADTLVLGNRSRTWNAHPILPALHVNTVADAVAIINRLNSQPLEYAALLTEQTKRLRHFCFTRPLRQILKAFSSPRRSG